jgi:ubiquitin carboxyl-terminal hydrolase 9/24
MTPYTQAYLKKKESPDDSSPESFQTPEYYQYKLRGVVIHVGTSDSGHYYSFIKEKNDDKTKKNDKWLEFNDISIRDFNILDLENEAFGGEDRNMQDYYGKGFREKSNNAYLLFYERVKFFDENDRETKKIFVPNENNNISKIYQDIIRDDNYR